MVREAAKRQDSEALGELLTERVKNWVLEKRFYTHDERADVGEIH